MKNQLTRENTARCFFYMLFSHIFSLLFILIYLPSAAQHNTPAVNIKTLTVEDGLSQSTVYSIAQDSKGFIWMATFNGLDRYDGNGFVHFRHDDSNPFSISSNQVRMILEDSHQRLWVSTNNNGLNYFDPVTRRFHHFFPGRQIFNMVEDAAGGLYVNMSDTIAYLKVKPDAKKELSADIAFFHITDSLISNVLTHCWLYADGNRNVFLTARSGLYSVSNRGTKQPFVLSKLYAYPDLKKFSINNPDPLQFLRDNQTGKYYLISQQIMLESNDSLFSHPVKVHEGLDFYGASFIDNRSRFWYTKKDTARVFNLLTGNETVFFSKADEAHFLGKSTVQLQDKSGTIWLSTESHGLMTYSDDENIFHSLLNNEYIGYFEKTGDQDFTTGHVKNWLVRLSGSRADVKMLTDKEKEAYHYFDFPHQDDKGICWRAEDGTVITAYDRNNKKVFQSPVAYHTYNAIRDDESTATRTVALRDTIGHTVYPGYLFFDHDACLWLYQLKDGLVFYDTKNNSYQLVKGNANFGLIADTKKRMYEDAAGTIWASIAGGVMTCRKTTRTIRYYLYGTDNTGHSLVDKNITSFCDDPADPKRIIWIGTRNGLSRMNKQTGICRNFGEKDGLPNNVVYDIVPDGKGNLWLSTNSGLSCLNTATFRFRNFTVSDGLQGSEFNGGATLTLPDGTLVFGGTNGLTYFNPADISQPALPLTVVTNVKVFGKSITNLSAGDVPVKDIAYATDVSVSYRDNVITFGFAGTDYRKKSALQYRYKLVPFDKDWQYPNDAHEATYTNLDPGNYTFVAEASNTNNVWGKESEPLQVHILPLWWQTWWCKGLAAIAVLAVFYGVYRYRLRKALEVERVRNRIASDLHDEIGSTLSAINLFSQIAHEQSKTATVSPQLLERINQTSQKVTQTMSDIVWSVSAKNDSFEKIITHMHEHAIQLMELKGYELSFTVDEKIGGISLSMEKRQNIYLIYKEALNNVVKYANGKHVWVSIRKEKTKLLLSVKDDGTGFDTGKRNGGNGLQNMKHRAAAINGDVRITSAAGCGSEVLVSVPV